MKTIRIANTDLCVPQIALGCMRLGDRGPDGAKAFVETALELGLNFFDHADIYGRRRVRKPVCTGGGYVSVCAQKR